MARRKPKSRRSPGTASKIGRTSIGKVPRSLGAGQGTELEGFNSAGDSVGAVRRYTASRSGGFAVISLENIPELADSELRKAKRTMAQRMSRILSGSRSLWPVDTGLSKGTFSVRSEPEGFKITNRAYSKKGKPYPYWVNNNQTIANTGKTNRNYRAIQRTLDATWADVVDGIID